MLSLSAAADASLERRVRRSNARPRAEVARFVSAHYADDPQTTSPRHPRHRTQSEANRWAYCDGPALPTWPVSPGACEQNQLGSPVTWARRAVLQEHQSQETGLPWARGENPNAFEVVRLSGPPR